MQNIVVLCDLKRKDEKEKETRKEKNQKKRIKNKEKEEKRNAKRVRAREDERENFCTLTSLCAKTPLNTLRRKAFLKLINISGRA